MSGKNIIYWGQDIKKFNKHRLSLTSITEVTQDDLIIEKSLENIKVLLLSLFASSNFGLDRLVWFV